MWNDARLDAMEQSRYGHAHGDRPHCRRCGEVIRGDDWRGGPVVGYICGTCELKLDDLQHDADLERDGETLGEA